MSDKIYIKGLSGKKGKYGIRLSFNVQKFTEELQQHANAKGYVNVFLNQSREPDRYGNDYYAVVDTWQPEPKSQPQQQHSVPVKDCQQRNLSDMPEHDLLF